MAETTADVLVIGAGASGAALAWSLAETRMHVVCLEQGDWVNPATLPGTTTSWELRQVGDFNFSPNTRGRREDYPVNDGDSPIAVSMFNAVGGSTILYAAHFPRLHPSDFRVRSLDGVAAYPPKELPLPPVPLGTLGMTLARGFDRLGWHWWPSDSAIATRDYEGRAACVNAGTCLVGCPQGAKASTDVTYCAAASSCGRGVGCGRSPSVRTAWRRASSTTTPTASSGGRRRKSWCSPATASARRACCSTRARRSSPTGSPTAAGSSGRT